MADVVVDPSVAAKWQLKDEMLASEAERLRHSIHARDLRLVVPAFWAYEIASIFSKAAANGRLTEAEARRATMDFVSLPSEYVPTPDAVAAFDAAQRFNRSVIDCFYLAIAEERGCDFWTDDRKLHRTLNGTYPFVRWIGDYPQPPEAPAQEG
jgi:predicted nucleic acid-binding protein